MKSFNKNIYLNSKEFSEDLLGAINKSKKRINIEMYIWGKDVFGYKILTAIKKASNRGVKVRILLDGWGSSEMIKTISSHKNIEIQVYNEFPSITKFFNLNNLTEVISGLNRRNHRKIINIDNEAFIGSFNLFKDSLTWRETMVRVEDKAYQELHKVFQLTWDNETNKRELNSNVKFRYLNINQSRQLRKSFKKNLIDQIDSARKRVWLTTPYLNLPFKIYRALSRAKKRGVDVRLIISCKTDFIFLSWMNKYFYKRLLKKGIRIYEYKKSLYHAKDKLIDDKAIIGSTNLNYRSFFKDLEISINITDKKIIKEIENSFEKDFTDSVEIVKPKYFNYFQRVALPFFIAYKKLY